MSRGPGKLQRYLTDLVMGSDKPMTFADIQAIAFPKGSYEADMAKMFGGSSVPVVRSLRRALKGLVDDRTLIAIGEGGRSDPKRYWLNPMMVALFSGKEQYERVSATLKTEPGGEAAVNKAAGAMLSRSKAVTDDRQQ
jgi:hypothetical protein